MEIHLTVGNIWPFYAENRTRLVDEEVLLAYDETYGYSIFLTDQYGHPRFIVENDNVLEAIRDSYSARDTEEVAKSLYVKYLFPIIVGSEDLPEEEPVEEEEPEEEGQPEEEESAQADHSITGEELDDLITEREDEIFSAFLVFLDSLVTEGDSGFVELLEQAELSDTMEKVLQEISWSLDLPIYRPTVFVNNVTGEEGYTDYPYQYEESDEDYDGLPEK